MGHPRDISDLTDVADLLMAVRPSGGPYVTRHGVYFREVGGRDLIIVPGYGTVMLMATSGMHVYDPVVARALAGSLVDASHIACARLAERGRG